jgi:hypothetical protein
MEKTGTHPIMAPVLVSAAVGWFIMIVLSEMGLAFLGSAFAFGQRIASSRPAVYAAFCIGSVAFAAVLLWVQRLRRETSVWGAIRTGVRLSAALVLVTGIGLVLGQPMSLILALVFSASLVAMSATSYLVAART